MPKAWRFLTHDLARSRELGRLPNVSPLVAQVLVARGYTSPAEVERFLHARLKDLHEPSLLPGVDAAADRMLAAIRQGRRITIYGDYDVDGVTATSLLWRCLRCAGAQVDYYVPHRLQEGYGLHAEALRKLHAEDPQRVVVTVDCGITSVAEARVAQELGLELIITDHHQFGEALPEAAAIVHPRLPGEASPFGDLCGAGVAFMLAWAVCQRLGDGKKSPQHLSEFLQGAVGLTAIGTVADVVPLVGDNRILVKHGLVALRDRCVTGLRHLLQVSGLHEKPEFQAEDIGFGLAPRLNAVGRLGQARLAVELLTTDNEARAQSLAGYIEEQNKVRQTVERRVFKQVKELLADHPAWGAQPALVLAHPEWHPGVIGIVASRAVEHFQRPVVLIAVNAAEGVGHGSGRTFGTYNLHAGLRACGQRLLTYGGHAASAGLRIRADQVAEFRDEFCAHVAAHHVPTDADLEVCVDSEIRLAGLTVPAVTDLDRLGPFGKGNPRPLFVSSDVEFAEPPRKIGEGGRHLAISLRQNRTVIRGIAFGKADWADEMAAAGRLSICYAPILNHFRGRVSVEAQLVDWRPAEASRPAAVSSASATGIGEPASCPTP